MLCTLGGSSTVGAVGGLFLLPFGHQRGPDGTLERLRQFEKLFVHAVHSFPRLSAGSACVRLSAVALAVAVS